MSERILVYLPLPRHAHWRGEGIAQTVENILRQSTLAQGVTVLTSAGAAENIADTFGSKPGLELRTWLGRRIASQTRLASSELTFPPARRHTIFDRVLARYGAKVLNLYSNLEYIALKFMTDTMLRWGLTAGDCSVIWIPQLAFNVPGKTRQRKVVSFWDPFVFEFAGFQNRAQLMTTLAYCLRTADFVVTQSEHNRDYLTSVIGLPPSAITVINNGAPNYSEAAKRFDIINGISESADRLPLQVLLKSWPDTWRRLTGHHAQSAFIHDKLNQSILFRLANDTSAATRIVFCSTQHRPYKGFDLLFAIYDKLVKSATGHDFRFVFTGEVPRQFKERYAWTTQRVYEMPRLSEMQHMCIYRVSSLVAHPSLAEGGLSSYPAFEAASLGIPSLTNAGRHTAEFTRKARADVSSTVADFANVDDVVHRIFELIDDPAKRKQNVDAINSSRVDWADAARSYAELFQRAAIR